MKKKLFLGVVILTIAVLTGCKAEIIKKERTMTYLLDGYVKAYTKADLAAAKDIFPDYYLEYNKKYVNQEGLDKELKNAKDTYGDDFNIIYKIEKETKFTDEELKTYNDKIKDIYKSKDSATECYKYDGTMTLKGSKKSYNYTLNTIARCNINSKFYLVRK